MTGPVDAAAFRRRTPRQGSAFLKLVYDGEGAGPFRWPSLDTATVAALVTAAHRRDVLVVAHATTAAAARDVVRAGADVLAHVPIDEVEDDLVAEIAGRGVAVIGTLATIDGFVNRDAGTALVADPDLGPMIGPAWSAVLAASVDRWRAAIAAPTSAATRRPRASRVLQAQYQRVIDPARKLWPEGRQATAHERTGGEGRCETTASGSVISLSTATLTSGGDVPWRSGWLTHAVAAHLHRGHTAAPPRR